MFHDESRRVPPEFGQVVFVGGRPAVVASVSPSAARDKDTVNYPFYARLRDTLTGKESDVETRDD